MERARAGRNRFCARGDFCARACQGCGVVPAHGVQRELPSSGQLELQFVYGYQGLRSRGNLYFLPSGEVAFHTASLVVVYEPRGHTQRFLAGHDAEVRCLALHPQGAVLASGQAASAAGEGASAERPRRDMLPPHSTPSLDRARPMADTWQLTRGSFVENDREN